MKTYSFAKLQARWFPKMEEIQHPFIYGHVKYVVNVSEQSYSPVMHEAFDEKGIKTFHFPLSETDSDMGLENIFRAVAILEKADKECAPAVVHCVGGDNRSRVVCECFHFKKTGYQLEDEYKGYTNHLIYNIAEKHLPPIEIISEKLKLL